MAGRKIPGQKRPSREEREAQAERDRRLNQARRQVEIAAQPAAPVVPATMVRPSAAAIAPSVSPTGDDKRPSRTLDALHAAQALLASVRSDPVQAHHKEFKAAAEEAPTMLRIMSLGPALAQLMAKGRQRAVLANALAGRLEPGTDTVGMLLNLGQMTPQQYRLKALQAADYLLAVKQLAQAYLFDIDEPQEVEGTADAGA